MRFGYEEFVRLGESRAFGEATRVELRRGRLVEMPSEGYVHLYVRSRLIRLFAGLEARLPPGIVWITDPTVRISDEDVVIPEARSSLCAGCVEPGDRSCGDDRAV
jgi:hypothetical protein